MQTIKESDIQILTELGKKQTPFTASSKKSCRVNSEDILEEDEDVENNDDDEMNDEEETNKKPNTKKILG